MLQIQDGHEKNMTCTYEDLKELQNKLMLMSGRGEQNQSEVEHFAEVCINCIFCDFMKKLYSLSLYFLHCL